MSTVTKTDADKAFFSYVRTYVAFNIIYMATSLYIGSYVAIICTYMLFAYYSNHEILYHNIAISWYSYICASNIVMDNLACNWDQPKVSRLSMCPSP